MAEPKADKQQPLSGLSTELGDEIHPFLKSISENIKPIIIVVFVFLLGLGAYLAYDAHAERSAKQAVEELGRIVLIEDAQQRRGRLEAYLEDAPSSAKRNVVLELVNVCMELEDTEAALAYLDQVDPPEGSDLGVVVDMSRARALALQGDHAGAIEVLERLHNSAPELYQYEILMQLASAAEASGDLAQARTAYQELHDLGQGQSTFLEYKIAELTKQLDG